MRQGTLLARPDVRWLWIGQVCSQLSDRLTQLILIALVAARAPGSSLALAKIMACTILPAFLVSPLAGALVDRWDRRGTMLVCDLARAAAVLLLPVAAHGAGMPALYALVGVLFGIACFFLPARQALLPALAPAEALVAANSLMTTSGMIAATMSVLVGGILVEQVGIGAGCLAAAASYLGSAGCILAIRARPAAAAPRPRVAWTGLVREIGEGLRYAFGQPHAQFVLGTLSLVVGAAGAVVIIATVLVQQALGSVTQDLGVFSVTLGLGLFLGAVAYGRIGHRWSKSRVAVAGLVGSGASLGVLAVGVGAWHSWAAGWAATTALGVCVAPIGIAVNAMIHELVADRLQGRVFSAMGIVMNAALLLGLGAAGITADRLSPRVALQLVSLLLVVGGGIGGVVAGLRSRARRGI